MARSIDEMIDLATVDSYGPYEQAWGWQCVLEENLPIPFKAKVFNKDVTVTGIDVDEENIVAVCKRNGKTTKIGLLELVLDIKKISGGEWIDAYRQWKGNS